MEFSLSNRAGLASYLRIFICLSVESLFDWLFLQVDMVYFFSGSFLFFL